MTSTSTRLVSTSTASERATRAWVEVDLEAVRANAQRILRESGARRLLAVVKADAYGLGAVAVAHALEADDPWGFAVATVEEAEVLRRSGITRPILVLMPAWLEAARDYRRLDLRAVVDDAESLRAWDGPPIHLEVDTGIGRTGVRWDDADALHAVDVRKLEGVFTHFHSAEDDAASIEAQWLRFERVLGRLSRDPSLLIHAANSAAAWRLGRPLDLVRPGLYLFGGRSAADQPEPRPVVTIRSRVVSVRRVRCGDTISYGAEWKAPRDTSVATLGIGYADGLSLRVSGDGCVLLRGRRRPIVGRVTMDLTMVDLGPQPSDVVERGEVATLLGADEGDAITLADYAAWSETSPYLVLTRLTPRLQRWYVAGGGTAR